LIVEAENAVRAGRVRLYIFKPSGRKRWMVVGRHGDYLVLPNAGYCSCHDFFFRVISEEKPACYHLLAVKLARERNAYQKVIEDDKNYNNLMSRWLAGRKAE